MGSTGRTYGDVIGLTGPLLPVVSFLGRLPTAAIRFGSVLLVARTSGSLTAAGLTGGAPAIGQVACGPLVGRLADRRGQRTVVLVFSLADADAAAIAALVAGALAGLAVPLPALLGAAAGATVPLIGPLGRARLVALARRSAVPESTVGAALSFESTLDELSFVLDPALVGLAAVLAHPAYAVGAAALMVALCGSGFARHPTARTTRSGPVATPADGRSRPDATSATRRSGPVPTPTTGCLRPAPPPRPPSPTNHPRPPSTPAPASPAPSTPSAPLWPSKERCSEPARRGSPRSASGSGTRSGPGSCTPPWG